MNTTMKCFVGEIGFSPAAVAEFLVHAHPRDFATILSIKQREGREHIWTNNAHAVDWFLPENVFVCSKNGIKSITEHPKFLQWKDEMLSGEFWSMVGEDW